MQLHVIKTSTLMQLFFIYKVLHFLIDDERKKLCASTFMKQKMFQITHDQIYHNDFHRTYDRIISSIYIRQLIKKLRTYIAHCFECQLN